MKDNIEYLTACLKLSRLTGNKLFFKIFEFTAKTNTPILLENKTISAEEDAELFL